MQSLRELELQDWLGQIYASAPASGLAPKAWLVEGIKDMYSFTVLL